MKDQPCSSRDPERRTLRIFAFDPMPLRSPNRLLWRASEDQIGVDVINEQLKPGPQGARIEVIDYDGANDCFYAPVDLNEPGILMQDGLEPSESDPQFHQQMVYAVTMKVLENFDRALGRRLHFRRKVNSRFINTPLRIFPHAFHGENAFFDPDEVALLFGYFKADKENPGENLPGQTVFACLSHDIITHEMTHALVYRLRRYLSEPSNVDVLAFHEGFSDIVAIFQHFSFQGILAKLVQEYGTKLQQSRPLIGLARQFGYATGKGEALRTAAEEEPDPHLYQTKEEPHERGSVLVAAVFDAFFMVYQRRIQDLIRIATGGSGLLPAGELHPDLVNRIAREVSDSAQSILMMCIRAVEYLAPVDIEFGDYLRALVTTDMEVSPDDEFCKRSSIIEGFRARGIYPTGVSSLAEDSLRWEPCEGKAHLGSDLQKWMRTQIILEGQTFKRNAPFPDYSFHRVAHKFHQWAQDHASMLRLDPAREIEPLGFHPSFRVGSQGQLLLDLVLQFAQEDKESYQANALGGIPLRGGTTVILSSDDVVRYIIAKPLPHPRLTKGEQRAAAERRDRQIEYVEKVDSNDPALAWYGDKSYRSRMQSRMKAALFRRMV